MKNRIISWVHKLFKKETPKQFNVKILRCSEPSFWYKKEIGKIYLVEESIDPKQYITIATNISGKCRGYINKLECEIVK